MRWIASMSGAIATAAAVVVLLSLAISVPTPAQGPTEVPSVVPAGPTMSTPATTTDTDSDVPIAGLDPVVAEVLAETGYAEFVGEGEIGDRLDPEVSQVLMDAGVVLIIPTEEGN